MGSVQSQGKVDDDMVSMLRPGYLVSNLVGYLYGLGAAYHHWWKDSIATYKDIFQKENVLGHFDCQYLPEVLLDT